MQLVEALPEDVLNLVAKHMPGATKESINALASSMIAGINTGTLVKPKLMAGSHTKAYPLRASIWHRDSTDEWVLELEGDINDVSFTARHPAPLTIPPEDVAGLGHLYSQIPD